ncbi:hypothetical protein BLNAU_4419 [Blattamonas nauphoetae]|uniref:Uncharacterized protein n=1 Tax=Blattamonas nauphoetae TaxID=2049346 RepID=A0ABQ9Y9R5_9EUKA|nr:hypothetical protein BLNAU_4419 [Blattamonas nauphoetae]
MFQQQIADMPIINQNIRTPNNSGRGESRERVVDFVEQHWGERPEIVDDAHGSYCMLHFRSGSEIPSRLIGGGPLWFIDSYPVNMYAATVITSLVVDLTKISLPSPSADIDRILRSDPSTADSFSIHVNPFDPSSTEPIYPNQLFVLFTSRNAAETGRELLKHIHPFSTPGCVRFPSFTPTSPNKLFLRNRMFFTIRDKGQTNGTSTIIQHMNQLGDQRHCGVDRVEFWMDNRRLKGSGTVDLEETLRGQLFCLSFFSLSSAHFVYSSFPDRFSAC